MASGVASGEIEVSGEPVERSFSRDLLDAFLPEQLEWERLVRRYPLTSIVLAAAAGFWLARRSGEVILDAVSESATQRLTGLVGEVLGEDER